LKPNPEYVLELSDEAYDDLVNIQSYTYGQHGENTWYEYGTDLDKDMANILEHPFSGHIRNDIPDGYQALAVLEHVMIYRVKDKTIYLVRILHGKMNFTFPFLK
jgi:toxin ParE1/3/4